MNPVKAAFKESNLIPIDNRIKPGAAVTWILHPLALMSWHYQPDCAASPVPPSQTLMHFPAILTWQKLANKK